MAAKTREAFLLARAQHRCEYCHAPAPRVYLGVHVEHIIPRQHGGTHDLSNLAIACGRCNAIKGPNLTAFDPKTGAITPLFHPRRDSWDEHFQIAGGRIMGRSAIGRATVALLDWNTPKLVRQRLNRMKTGIRFA